MNLQNLPQGNCTLLTIKIMDNMAMEMKMVQLLSSKQVIKSNLCDYSDAYVLVTEDGAAVGGDENTPMAFKNCAPFKRCVTHINDEHVETVQNLYIIM